MSSQLESLEEQMKRAIGSGSLRELTNIINKGANLHYVTDSGKNIIDLCNNHEKSIYLLTQLNFDEKFFFSYLYKNFFRASEIAHRFLDYGADPAIRSEEGDTLLHFPLDNPFMERVLKVGLDINSVGKDGRTALHKKIKNRHFDSAFFLLNKGADAGTIDDLGETVLISFLKEIVSFFRIHIRGKNANLELFFEKNINSYIKLLNKLFENGASFDQKNKNYYSRFLKECYLTDFALIFLKNGFSIETIIRLALSNRDDNLLQYLIENNFIKMNSQRFNEIFQISTEDNSLFLIKTCLIKYSEHKKRPPELDNYISELIEKRNIEVLKILLDLNLIERKEEYSKSIQFISIIERDMDLFYKIFKLDNDLSYRDQSENTLLLLATKMQDTEMIRSLVRVGFDVNAVDKQGKTPLFFAVEYKENVICRVLLEDGAAPNIIDHSNGKSPLILAVENKDYSTSRLLLEYGADPNVIDSFQWTSLMYACKAGDYELVNLLISYHADCSYINSKKETVIAEGFASNHTDLIELLLKNGASPNSILINYSNRQSPLLNQAIANGWTKLSNLLIDWNANPNLTDYSGNTALHIAYQVRYMDMITKLIEIGADQDKRNNEGIVPSDINILYR